MLKIFKKSINSNNANKEDTLVMIVSLLVHAAKIDENYTDKEKNNNQFFKVYRYRNRF